MNNLYNNIKGEIHSAICTEDTGRRFFERLEEGKSPRDENPASHFCCYFLPYNPLTKNVFIVHHKKSGLWLAPGGHIDEGEELIQALNREIEEELGVRDRIKGKMKPFLLTITLIERSTQSCKEHFDIWYRFVTDGTEFRVDPREFYQTRWLSVDEARRLVTDQPNIEALNKMERLLKVQD